MLDFPSYMVVLATSFMLSSGSALSGQRRTHGAKTMASELGDMRLCASTLHTLKRHLLDISLQLFLHRILATNLLLNQSPYLGQKQSQRSLGQATPYLTRWKMSLCNVWKFAGGSSSSTL